MLNLNSEGRNPKTKRNPNAEARISRRASFERMHFFCHKTTCDSAFGFQAKCSPPGGCFGLSARFRLGFKLGLLCLTAVKLCLCGSIVSTSWRRGESAKTRSLHDCCTGKLEGVREFNNEELYAIHDLVIEKRSRFRQAEGTGGKKAAAAGQKLLLFSVFGSFFQDLALSF